MRGKGRHIPTSTERYHRRARIWPNRFFATRTTSTFLAWQTASRSESSSAVFSLEQEVPSIEDFKGVVEKLRVELATVRKATLAEPKEEK
jgi:hypothetical protein